MSREGCEQLVCKNAIDESLLFSTQRGRHRFYVRHELSRGVSSSSTGLIKKDGDGSIREETKFTERK